LKSKAERAFLALAGKPGDDHFLTAMQTPRLRRPFRALRRFGVTNLRRRDLACSLRIASKLGIG
jgi:hypothetical protein